MNFKSFIDIYTSNGFDADEAKSEISFALDILFNYTSKDFLLNKNLTLTQQNKVLKIFKERCTTKRPIQQIIGKSFFFSRIFYVNEYTLIPRPETELLVQSVLDLTKTKKTTNVLDLCTGTGCIGLTLMLENPFITSDLADIQQNAIELSKKNADLYKLLNRSNFIVSDLFENITKKYDVIVSNPPYIPIKEKQNLQAEVRDFEIPIALFAKDNDGIEFYDKIISQAPDYLNKNGYIAFELGINQSEKVKNLLVKNNFSQIKIIKDLNSIDRVITAIY